MKLVRTIIVILKLSVSSCLVFQVTVVLVVAVGKMHMMERLERLVSFRLRAARTVQPAPAETTAAVAFALSEKKCLW
jgi:hypothetical protein